MAILYEVLNEIDWILAERSYAVWPDLEAKLREHGIPQFTLETHRPVGAFDLLGFSLSTELGYTNLLNALDLAGIPLHSAERTEEHPIVLVGGHAAFNPEPLADFIDAAVLGDGEEASLRIADIVREWKAEGRPAAATRCCCGWRRPVGSMCRGSTTWTTSRTAGSAGSRRIAPAYRSGSPSTR